MCIMNNFFSQTKNQRKSQTRGTFLLKQIFVYCLNNGTSIIPDIAKALNYSVPAITKHVIDLCENGYFIDHGKVEVKGGRPPCLYGVNPNSCYFVGVDIRSLSLSIGLVNLCGDVISISTDRRFVFRNDREVLEDVCRRVKQFISITRSEGKILDVDKILNVNVNIAGRVNPSTGYSFSHFNMGETPLSSVFSDNLGYNVTIDNDTNAMAYGEYCNSFIGKPINMICVNMGYGVGMGIIIKGELFEGKSGYAGELGHISVFDNEIMCHCGKKGCLETETSGVALLREVLARINSGSESVLSKAVMKGKQITIYDIIGAIVKSEDMLCIEILETIGFKMGKQIANMINLFNPDHIVISGLLSETGDYLLQPIKMSVKKYALTLVSKDTEITISKLNNKSGVLGACLIARNRALTQ